MVEVSLSSLVAVALVSVSSEEDSSDADDVADAAPRAEALVCVALALAAPVALHCAAAPQAE